MLTGRPRCDSRYAVYRSAPAKHPLNPDKPEIETCLVAEGDTLGIVLGWLQAQAPVCPVRVPIQQQRLKAVFEIFDWHDGQTVFNYYDVI